MNLAKEMPSNNIVEVNCFEELYAIFPSEHCRKFSDGAEAVVLNFADYTIIGLSFTLILFGLGLLGMILFDEYERRRFA